MIFLPFQAIFPLFCFAAKKSHKNLYSIRLFCLFFEKIGFLEKNAQKHRQHKGKTTKIRRFAVFHVFPPKNADSIRIFWLKSRFFPFSQKTPFFPSFSSFCITCKKHCILLAFFRFFPFSPFDGSFIKKYKFYISAPKPPLFFRKSKKTVYFKSRLGMIVV